ncbi:precorrin-8X methylmutase, partial [Pseudomonas aeruginosa]|uniref:precorrin-8X methylmutase n=1 Tax=Pseudomonas aeruginosa TaxID=287 RepID=UPI0021F0E24F
MIDYIRDGQAIYRQSFATIRAEANLAGIPADLEKLAVRVIHACGMVDVVDDLRFSPDAGAAGRPPPAAARPARKGRGRGGRRRAPRGPRAPPPPR